MRRVACWVVSVFSLIIVPMYNLAWAEQTAEPARRQIELATIDYPPLIGDGKRQDLMNEVSDAVFQLLDIEVSYKVYPMARIARAVASNSIDGALGSSDWFYQHELENPVYFITFHDLRMNFFYLQQRFPRGLKFTRLEDLGDYSIGYLRGGSLLPMFARAKLQPDLVRNLSQNVQKVYAGRDDMFAAVDIGGWASIRELYPSEVESFGMSEQAILIISSNLILSQRNADLVPMVEQALQTLIDRGVYRAIVERYYPSPFPRYIDEFTQRPVTSFSSEDLSWE
ncbi:substrate-binding periplasmic protein [Agarivorans sp.]|uniref:substrate-binding periplasmic protein n=1 Tax=Agarivorans sp. TaxID=1872412 RepID=UPI003CFC6499